MFGYIDEGLVPSERIWWTSVTSKESMDGWPKSPCMYQLCDIRCTCDMFITVL